jgi:MFS family permease
MTSLNPDPLVVSLVQVATTLPMFLVAIPAGALADILDMRRFLLIGETVYTIVSAIFAAIVWFGLATPTNLLLFTFLTGVAGALVSPAWQAVVPQLVPKQDLNPAVAANSAGVNVSRAVGPALGGVIVAQIGISAPFWINAVSNLGVVGALLWWRPPQKATQHLPVERFYSAIRTGFRYARNNPQLRATLIRAVSFFLFASAYWALLPLVTRNQITGGPDLYGYLLGAIGAAAVGAALALPWLKPRLGRIVWWQRGRWVPQSRWCCSGSLAIPRRHWPRVSSPAHPGLRSYRASMSPPSLRSRIGCAVVGSQYS